MSSRKSVICPLCGYDKPLASKYCYHCMVSIIKYNINEHYTKLCDYLAEELKKQYKIDRITVKLHHIDNLCVEGALGAYRVERIYYSNDQRFEDYFYCGTREVDAFGHSF